MATDDNLRADAQKLVRAVTELTENVGLLTRRAKRSERFIVYLALSLALDVLLTVVITFTGYQVVTVSSCQEVYVGAVTAALKSRDESAAQARRSSKELWLAFLQNSPATPGQKPTAEQRQRSLDALNRYLASIDASDRARQVYPLPDNRCASIWP